MRIVIHTEAQYLPAFREMARAVKAKVEAFTDEEKPSKTPEELIAAGILQPAKSSSKKSLSEALDEFDGFPLTYQDAKSLRRDAWKRND